jgi:hypothetical protein
LSDAPIGGTGGRRSWDVAPSCCRLMMWGCGEQKKSAGIR